MNHRRDADIHSTPSIVEDRQVELAEAHRVGEYIYLDDFPTYDREAEDRKRLSPGGRDNAHGSVDERRSSELGKPPEGECLVGHGPRAADFPGCARGTSATIGAEHDVGVEHRDERIEVSVAGGSEERAHHLSLA